MTCRWLALVGAAMLTSVMAVAAQAGDARLTRVVLLRSGDRMSLALELTAEPQKAVLRTLSARVLEVEAGPLAGPVREVELAPSSGVPLVRHVSIRGYTMGTRTTFVRARILLHEPGLANMRVVGRVVYIDLVARRAPVPST